MCHLDFFSAVKGKIHFEFHGACCILPTWQLKLHWEWSWNIWLNDTYIIQLHDFQNISSQVVWRLFTYVNIFVWYRNLNTTSMFSFSLANFELIEVRQSLNYSVIIQKEGFCHMGTSTHRMDLFLIEYTYITMTLRQQTRQLSY